MLVTSALLSAAVLSALPPQAAAARHPTPVWVTFVDKPAARGAIDPSMTPLTQRALDRRAKRRSEPGLVDARDLPVEARYVSAVLSTGVRLREESRWLNAVSIEASPAALKAIRSMPFVRSVQPVRVGHSEPTSETPLLGTADATYGASDAQVAQMDLVRLHNRGFHGEGMVIGILDTGFHREHEAFFSPEHPLQVVAEWDFLNNDPNTDIEEGDDPNQHRHGTWILGTLASYLPGELVGTAYGASYVLCKTEDVTSETPIEEDHYVAGLEFIEAHGADLATSSLGYIDWYTQADLDGATAVTTIAVNTATANGLVCCTAAGNEGHDDDPATSTIIAPADAFEVLTCGAVDGGGVIADFSSSGPTADGRIKPEILARGVATATINSTQSTGLSAVSGTSLSTPLIAGASACILQARPDLSVKKLRGALLATASEGSTPDPLFVRGYGILQADVAASLGRVAGDINLDGHVNASDLAILLGAWGGCSPCETCVSDLNGDCAVDAADLAILLGNWG